ncbi:MAG TPA: CBS domain-containing protein, partial [Solirubrobacteraceae bacterium]|nr:CBS domain-containing protein [Solirubrobacteraceae bacterium]
RFMREDDVGALVVERDGEIAGIVTDRDIVVRGIADGRDPDDVRIEEVATTGNVVTIPIDASIDDAIRLMREHDVRRIVVEQDGRPAGVVSLGDLAIERDPGSVLADISSDPPNN